MKALLLLEDKLNGSWKNIIKNNSDCGYIIVTDANVSKLLNEAYPDRQIIHIDIFSNMLSDQKIKISEMIVNMLKDCCRGQSQEEDDLIYPFINMIHYSGVNIIFNIVYGIESVIKDNSIDNLVLVGGNRAVEYIALSLAEKERPFRLLYKRNWFLNYYIYNAFNSKISIDWINEESYAKLRFFKNIRSVSVVYGKMFVTIINTLKLKLTPLSNQSQRIKDNHDKADKYALLFVRSPLQIEPLVPIYEELKKRGDILPLYVSFGNYSSRMLDLELSKRHLEYFPLKNLLNLRSLFKTAQKVIKSHINHRHQGAFIDVQFGDNQIQFEALSILDEISMYWFDIILRKTLLDKFVESNIEKHKIKFVMNAETHNQSAAADALWANGNQLPIYGVQYLTFEEMIPRISWVDTMFVIDKIINDRLNTMKENERFMYLGPVAFDKYYNTKRKSNRLASIGVFTQPDDFTSDFIAITSDIIDIRNKFALDFDIVVKLHPREKRISSFKSRFDSIPKVEIVSNEISSNDLLKAVDLAVSIRSGTMLQSIIIGTPVLCVNYNRKYKEDFDFLIDRVTYKAHSYTELEQYIQNYDKYNESFYKDREDYISRYIGDYQGNAASKIIDYITS